MSGFINNFYYGKAGQADYTPDQMPKNRFQLFFEMLRIHFSGMMGINLVYLLFCIPALLWTLINFSVLISGAEAADYLDQARYSILPMYLLGMVPCLGIAGIGAPGLMYVLRNWSRDQHSFMMSDFKDNVKANWKNGVLVGLLNGFLSLAAYVGFVFYGQQAAQSVFFIIPQMLVLIMAVCWWMMNMIIYPMMVTYDMKFSQLVRNSLIICIARLPWALLTLLGSILPVFIVLFVVGSIYGYLALGLIYLVCGFAITGLVYASFANACFDRLLNPNIEGATVGMGLRDPSLDDEDDDDIDDPNPLT